MAATLPFPPLELANRVGSLSSFDDPIDGYNRIGRNSMRKILSLLGPDFDLEGKRILDFGCGAGRILRHFVDAAPSLTLVGTDIDRPSIDWINANLPGVTGYATAEMPPLPLEDASIDLVYCSSVFTHLADSWSSWMCELNRVIVPGGHLVATVIPTSMCARLGFAPLTEDEVGMNVHRHWQTWDSGGPIVMHSEWWIRGHWGRAFEVLAIDPLPPDARQRWLLARKHAEVRDPAVLEAPIPDEPREYAAMLRNRTEIQEEIDRELPHIVTAKKYRPWTDPEQVAQAAPSGLRRRVHALEASYPKLRVARERLIAAIKARRGPG